MNYGEVEEPSSSRSRRRNTARRAAISGILTATLSRSDKASRTSRTADARRVLEVFDAIAQLRKRKAITHSSRDRSRKSQRLRLATRRSGLSMDRREVPLVERLQ